MGRESSILEGLQWFTLTGGFVIKNMELVGAFFYSNKAEGQSLKLTALNSSLIT